ncbi:MAG: ABC transporter permease, partial [Actinomycetota bacterium]|nr:ABC transporter permease [Actinomycetota bacterium]
VTTYVAAAARQDVVSRNAVAAGTSLQALSRGADVQYDVLRPAAGNGKGQARIGAIAFGVLFYLASLLFGIAIANSVVEEKQNRVVEILAAAIPTRQLLIRKVVGNTVLAVAQVALLSALAALGLVATGNTTLLGDIAEGGLWFLVFFLVGFLTLACLWAVVGALATRSEDIQSSSTPMTILVVAVFAIGSFGTGIVAQVASYVPLLSTVAMPARVVGGQATWWQALLSLAIAAVAAYAIILFAERMYRGALLQTGSRTTYRQALARAGSTRSAG